MVMDATLEEAYESWIAWNKDLFSHCKQVALDEKIDFVQLLAKAGERDYAKVLIEQLQVKLRHHELLLKRANKRVSREDRL